MNIAVELDDDEDEAVNVLLLYLEKFDPPAGAPAAVSALRARDCRWPLGDPSKPGFRFCCAPVVGCPEPFYCDAHTKIHKGKRGLVVKPRRRKRRSRWRMAFLSPSRH